MSLTLLGIDLGTTRLKVAAFAQDGALLRQVTTRHVAGPAGQSADDWWRDAVAAIRELNVTEVAGVALSGRAGAGVFVDDMGEVLVQPWADDRHATELSALLDWRAQSGRSLSNYGAALVAKYLWLRRHEPEIARRCRYALYGKDFLLFRLTGAHLTDWSSGPDAAAWDGALLADWGLGDDLLPTPALPWEIAGGLTKAAAAETGLRAGTPVAVGAHDGICANVGAGAIEPGEYAITLGTHAVARTVTLAWPPGATRFYALPPDRHIIGGNAMLGGRALDWLLDITKGAGDREQDYREADSLATALSPGAEGVTFLPFLAGQVAPDRRPAATGAFAGLRLGHGRAALYRAVFEGAAFAVADVVDQVAGWCGPPNRIRLTGGGAASPLWRQILADVLNSAVEATDDAVEGRGAAMFLAVGIGMHPDYAAAVDAMVPAVRRFEPVPSAATTYATVRARWRSVRDIMRPLDALD